MFTPKRNANTVYLLMTGASALFFSLIVTVNMIYQVEVVELNPLQLVLVGTLLETSVFLFEVPTGVVADSYSRRLSIIIGMFLIGAGFMLEGAVPRFEAVLMAQVLWGVGYTFTSGATEAWIADEVGDDKAGEAFMRGSQIGTIGGLVAIPVSVALGSLDLQLPIVLGGALFVALGGVLIVIMPETGFTPTPREERQTWGTMRDTFMDGLRVVRGRQVLLIFMAVGLFFGLSSEGWDRLWTPHLLENFSFPDVAGLEPVAWFGVIRATTSVLSLGAVEMARRRLKRLNGTGAAPLLWFLNAVRTGAIVVFALTGSFTIAVSAFLVAAVFRGVGGPVMRAWINPHIDSKVRATVYSMAGQVDAIGQVVGGPGIGYIGTAWSIRAALVAGAIIVSPVLVLLARATRLERRLVATAEV